MHWREHSENTYGAFLLLQGANFPKTAGALENGMKNGSGSSGPGVMTLASPSFMDWAYKQGCRSCSILPSRMGEHGVSLENMGNMENMENMEKMENINQMTQKSPEDF